LPACARCAGIYLGTLLACLFYLVPGKRRVFLIYPGRAGAAAATIAILPCAADFALARVASPLAVGNEARFVLSLLAGWGAWVLLVGAAAYLRWGPAPGRRLSAANVFGSLVLLLVPVLGAAAPHPAAARVLAAATLVGALAFYALLNYLPLALLLHGRRTSTFARALVVAGLVALAVVEIKWGYVVYAAARRMLS
jgi:uncharacterized membrane protein